MALLVLVVTRRVHIPAVGLSESLHVESYPGYVFCKVDVSRYGMIPKVGILRTRSFHMQWYPWLVF